MRAALNEGLCGSGRYRGHVNALCRDSMAPGAYTPGGTAGKHDPTSQHGALQGAGRTSEAPRVLGSVGFLRKIDA